MSEKITFRELVELIAEQSKQSQSSTNSFVSELVGVIENGLRETGSVSISGFGKFELRWMSERAGRNPQTGEPITIPAQNKVYFKPFKALREDVNRPYSNMEAQILEDVTLETEKISETEPAAPPSGKEKKEDAEPDASDENAKDVEKKAPAKVGSPIPLAPPEEPEEEDNGDHLLIERSVPESTDQMQDADEVEVKHEVKDEVEVEEEEMVKNEHEYEGLLYSPDRSGEVIPESLFSVPEPAESETAPKATPVSTASSSLAKKSARPDKDRSRFSGVRWLDIAAGVILILSAVAIFFMLRQDPGTDAPQQAASEQQEQAPEPEQTESAPEPGTEPETSDQSASTEDEPAADAESETQAAADAEPGTDTDAESAFDTSPYTINRGESLWSISEIRMNNPYFWPVIYNLNSGLTNNPNLIPANAQLSVPFISNPENLTSRQLEEVAKGYLSIYDWAVDNQPENARFFLWAVGVFSVDVLSDAQNRVDPDDWQFAVSR